MIYTKVVLISFAALLLFMWIRVCTLDQRLLESHILTHGYVYRVSPSGWKAHTPMFHYYYLVNEKKEYSAFTLDINDKDTLVFLRKYFPVAYYSDNPSYNAILIENKDFTDIGIPRPDSLKWVDTYIRKW